MAFTSILFSYIHFYYNSSASFPIVYPQTREGCINYCSDYLISTLPGVEDAKIIKQSKVGKVLSNEVWIGEVGSILRLPVNRSFSSSFRILYKTMIMQPFEFHTSIKFDFSRQQWFQNNFLWKKSIAQDNWATDANFKKYPILKDSFGIKRETKKRSFGISIIGHLD